MARYGVTYWESYSRYYEVEANSAEEAENMVIDGICNGELPGSDDCYDSGYDAEKIEEE